MASIDSLSSSIYVPLTSQTQGVQSTQGAGSDPDGDGDGGTRVKKSGGHGHGHGQMQNVLMQALQSLGLTGATGSSASGSSSSNTQSGTSDSDGDSDGSTTGVSSTKADMRQFMHALFQAVKADSSSAASATGTSSTSTGSDPKASFAAGLSSLISQVSSGQAPADLQNAFAKVVNDLQGSSASSTTTSSGGSTTAVGGSTANPQVTLQALLSKMQQNLGYGPASTTPNLSNILSAQA